jgi:hypothetical protein
MGPPQRSATAAWQIVVKLVGDTLTQSDRAMSDAVAASLDSLHGLGPALIAAGHLESAPLVLVSGPLHVSLTVVTGSAITSVEENLNPVPGGGSATEDWLLYLPASGPLTGAIIAAANQSTHLSTESPPQDAQPATSTAASPGLVDFAALDKLRGPA